MWDIVLLKPQSKEATEWPNIAHIAHRNKDGTFYIAKGSLNFDTTNVSSQELPPPLITIHKC